nr:MAG TPA: hypothetical protein [Caudoviricetes sp.]
MTRFRCAFFGLPPFFSYCPQDVVSLSGGITLVALYTLTSQRLGGFAFFGQVQGGFIQRSVNNEGHYT